MNTPLDQLFPKQSLIPVVVIQNADDAVPLARALLAGGITSIEITLRTEAGLEAITRVAEQVPEIIVGAGTVATTQQMDAAAEAGAQFQVSPGITPALAAHAVANKISWLPGVNDASAILLASEYGLDHLKFFPASLSGGVPMLKQFASVFPGIRFCPTGGVSLSNLHEYATLPGVFAIGGSWLTPKQAVADGNWQEITRIAANSVTTLREMRQAA